MKRIKCYSCGTNVQPDQARPFGHVDGQVQSWVCAHCDDAAKQPAEVVTGGPRIAWATIAKAHQLVDIGAGWSVDHVIRRGLESLEITAAARG
ncbi:MAG TPA: hypothetical protein VF202_03105 [Trueperaceae bacterium]|jgi:hypothetical protein